MGGINTDMYGHTRMLFPSHMSIFWGGGMVWGWVRCPFEVVRHLCSAAFIRMGMQGNDVGVRKGKRRQPDRTR